jgi:peptide/nickel transport system ATP-binding protein
MTFAARGLVVAFGGVPVVHGIDFEVAAGECLAVVGESGSGKSQSCLAPFGLTPATVAGSVRLGETELVGAGEAALRQARRRAGFVFQQPLSALTPHLRIGAQLAESKGDAQGLDALLDEVRIADPARVLRQYPHELSGGMRQRVMIAMALASAPDLLIADEPTTALDVLVQRQILDLLDDVRRARGLAMLLVSHDLALVAGRADRVMVMRGGRVEEAGPTAQVLRAPQTDYAAALIAAAPRLDAPVPGRPPVGDVLLQAEGVRVDFGRRTVVSDAALEVRAGEGVALVGASGSGKSTLARAVARLGPMAAGALTWRGRALPTRGAMRADDRRGFQCVFQDPVDSLDPRLTVAEAVAEPLVTLRPDIARGAHAARVCEALALVELDPGLSARRPRELSGGQAQRVCIARALIAEPDLLICDEATSALDVSVQAGIVALLQRLQRERGLALLFISHDLALVRSLCHRIVVLEAGRVVEVGDAEAVIADPQSEAAKALVAAAQ